MESPQAPVHNVVSFMWYNLVKPNVQTSSLFLIPFKGIACKVDRDNTNFHSVWPRAVFRGKNILLFFLNKLFELFNSKRKLSTDMRLVQPVLY